MELLAVILAVTCVALLAWALSLRQRMHALDDTPSPPPTNLDSPLFHAVTAEFDAGVIVLDDERQVRYLNPQAEALLEIRSDAAVGQGLINVLRDYKVDALVIDVQRDAEARETVLQPPAGGRTLRLRVSRFTAGDSRGIVVLIRDVTQLSMLERARRDMVANVSHELRNPLASVKLLVETLQSGPPPAVSQRMLNQMAEEVDAIAQLVDELHELSQIESRRVALQLSPQPLGTAVARALERIRPQAERKSLQVDANVPAALPPALMDADRVGQVLLNLLHNAVKFTPDGGRIAVDAVAIAVAEENRRVGRIAPSAVSPAESGSRRSPPWNGRSTIALPQAVASGEWLLVGISDTGIGIPAEELPRIFERFYKVDRARSRYAGGTGLGLAIAKHLIEGHGGCVWASSEEGVGSTFYFVLPVA